MEFDLKSESEMFDKAAEYYDRYRPGYPKEIIEALVNNTNLNKDSSVLEIGAGSGKATELFKNYGFPIHCIEPGENLVRNGKNKFKNDSHISFECGRFEELPDRGNKYDVIFAAQAFHWIPQPLGYQKCAALLKKGGYLAPFWNMYLYYDNEEDRELLKLSEKYRGFADFVEEKQAKERIERISADMETSGLFNRPAVYRHFWKKEYTAAEYYGFVQTGNRFLQLPNEMKENARKDLAEHARKFNGKLLRPYLCVLYLAQVQ